MNPPMNFIGGFFMTTTNQSEKQRTLAFSRLKHAHASRC